MTRRRLLILGWVLVLGLSATLPLSAVFRGVFHIGPAPLVLRGPADRPVIALGGDVVLKHGTRSTVVAIGGSIHLQGSARDDLVALGGDVYLNRGSATVQDVLAVPGSIYRAPRVQVGGRLGGALHRWNGRAAPTGSPLTGILARSMRLGLAAGLALLLVGTALTVVFPWQIILISSTLRAAPLKSAVAGMLAVTIFVFLVVPLGLSLAGLPFAVLLTGAASLAWVFGVTSAAVVLGRVVSRGTVSLLWATAAGLVVIALGMAVPVLGPLAVTIAGLAGAGALAVALVNRANPASPLP